MKDKKTRPNIIEAFNAAIQGIQAQLGIANAEQYIKL